ncbi:hypothetical protein E2562_038970 [Oryza meyeriana var. granulata]|uniref:Uncharacterized protein n=1 Tax=Oryza meyeriana var. granulata TaxID=110450 RepID=A0A6G1ECW3_9ORYZ|nr:hypothetical protein E2562_038970 [Oryza meyeriana var. granulata]
MCASKIQPRLCSPAITPQLSCNRRVIHLRRPWRNVAASMKTGKVPSFPCFSAEPPSPRRGIRAVPSLVSRRAEHHSIFGNRV